METVTSCPVCFCRYTKDRLPLVLGCGHTFCKVCVSRVPRCPFCRRNVTSTAANLLILQLTGLPAQEACPHDRKDVFCPLCCFSLCLQCLTQHNLHGLVPVTDPSVVATINEKMQGLKEKLENTNKEIAGTMEQVSMLYHSVATAYEEQVEVAKFKFQMLRTALDNREREIMDDIAGVFDPLTSKLLSLTADLDKCLKTNAEKLELMNECAKMTDEEKIKTFRPVEVLTQGSKITEKISSRARKLPALSINIERVMDFIRVVGKMEVPLEKKLSLCSV